MNILWVFVSLTYPSYLFLEFQYWISWHPVLPDLLEEQLILPILRMNQNLWVADVFMCVEYKRSFAIVHMILCYVFPGFWLDIHHLQASMVNQEMWTSKKNTKQVVGCHVPPEMGQGRYRWYHIFFHMENGVSHSFFLVRSFLYIFLIGWSTPSSITSQCSHPIIHSHLTILQTMSIHILRSYQYYLHIWNRTSKPINNDRWPIQIYANIHRIEFAHAHRIYVTSNGPCMQKSSHLHFWNI